MTPRIRRAKPRPDGVPGFPSRWGKSAVVLPGITVLSSSLGILPEETRIMGTSLVKRAAKARSSARRGVRKRLTTWNRRAPMIIHVVVLICDPMMPLSMNLRKPTGAASSLDMLCEIAVAVAEEGSRRAMKMAEKKVERENLGASSGDIGRVLK